MATARAKDPARPRPRSARGSLLARRLPSCRALSENLSRRCVRVAGKVRAPVRETADTQASARWWGDGRRRGDDEEALASDGAAMPHHAGGGDLNGQLGRDDRVTLTAAKEPLTKGAAPISATAASRLPLPQSRRRDGATKAREETARPELPLKPGSGVIERSRTRFLLRGVYWSGAHCQGSGC
jgi:hypothetical protein